MDAHIARDRKSTRLNSSHLRISYAVFCLKKKKQLEIMSCCLHSTCPETTVKCMTNEWPNSEWSAYQNRSLCIIHISFSLLFFFKKPGPPEISSFPLPAPLPS